MLHRHIVTHILFMAAVISAPLSASKWTDRLKARKATHTDRPNPGRHKITDPCCKDLKVLNKEHKQLEKDSFYESVALLTLLSKKDIKDRLPQIPVEVLKSTIEEMESTYVWMERASQHAKTPEDLKNLLTKTLIPRSKYLVNAMNEMIHQYNTGKRGGRGALGHAGSNRKKK